MQAKVEKVLFLVLFCLTIHRTKFNTVNNTNFSAKMDNNSKQLKAFNVKLTVEEVDEINRLRDLREKPRGRKHAISIIDWIVEAVQDKIRKEKQENGLK